MAIKENVLPLAQDSGSGYIRTVSSGGASQRTAFDTVKGAITADMDEAIADEVDAREAADNQLQTEIDGKVDKVTGKGLSTNDFTNALKTKLDGIEAGAEVNVIETVKVNGTALVPDANRAVNVPAPTVDSALSTTSENPVQNKIITGAVNDLKEEINDKSNWTVGSAEQLVSDEASQTDVTPYTFRRSGGGLIPFNFTREELAKVVGGTVAWNQLVQNGNFADATIWASESSAVTFTVSGNVATVTNTTGSSAIYQRVDVVNGHKYIMQYDAWADSNMNFGCSIGSANYFNATKAITTSKARYVTIAPFTGTTSSVALYIYPKTANVSSYITNVTLTDLTAMLGTTIADYIYSLETATEGSGIEKLREWGFFRDSYYSYDSGSLQSVCVGAHECVGFNAWDEEWEVGNISAQTGTNTSSTTAFRSKNLIPVLPETEYYFKVGNGVESAALLARYYDAEGNYIGSTDLDENSNGANRVRTMPSNCHYFRFTILMSTYGSTTYNNDICINLSDANRNGEYQPYQKYIYTLDGTTTLLGLFKLDSSNKLYADGDEYLPSGEVSERYGEVDLGTLNWTNAGGYKLFTTTDLSSIIRKATTTTEVASWVVSSIGLTNKSYNSISASTPFSICVSTSGGILATLDVSTAYADANAFKTAMNGVKLVFEKTTPSTSTADPYTAIQICDSDGTEEFVDALVEAGTRDVAIPAGTETVYYEDMAGKLAELPPIPSAPSANGTYTLQAVVSSGTVTYQWQS